MDLVFFNAWWMTFNISLAVISIVAGWLMIKTRFKLLQLLFGIIWIIFVPNTIYMITDLEHLFPHLARVTILARPLIALQFVFLTIIGVITFILGLYPLELLISKIPMRNRKIVTYSIITFISIPISFGVVLGRVYRIHSWELFTNTSLVAQSAVITVNSPFLLLFVFAFGIGSSLLYFILRKSVLSVCYKILLKFHLQQGLRDQI